MIENKNDKVNRKETGETVWREENEKEKEKDLTASRSRFRKLSKNKIIIEKLKNENGIEVNQNSRENIKRKVSEDVKKESFNAESVKKNNKHTEIRVDWYVGGSVNVEATWLSIHVPPSSHLSYIKTATESTPASTSTSTSSSTSSTSTSSTTYSSLLSGSNWSAFLAEIDTPTVVPMVPESKSEIKKKEKNVLKKRNLIGSDINKKLNIDLLNGKESNSNGEIQLKDENYIIMDKDKESGSGSSIFNIDSSKTKKIVSITQHGNGTVPVTTLSSTSTSTSTTAYIQGTRDSVSMMKMTFPVPASYAQMGLGRWGSGQNPANPQIFSAAVRVGVSTDENNNIGNNSYIEKVEIDGGNVSEASNNQRNSTNIHDISNIIYLSPGIYYIIAWSKVDPSWGTENQGLGSTNPESYLANGRTNIEWISKQPENESKKNFAKKRNNFFSSNNDYYNSSSNNNNINNYNTHEKTVDAKEEYERMRGRIVKGRKLWPSDPIIILIKKNGEIILLSSVKKCAWWDRKDENNFLMNSDSPSSAFNITNENNGNIMFKNKTNNDNSNKDKNNENNYQQNKVFPTPIDSMDSEAKVIDSNQQNDIDFSLNFWYNLDPDNFYTKKSSTVFFIFLFFIAIFLIFAIRNFRQCFLNFGDSQRRQFLVQNRNRQINIRN